MIHVNSKAFTILVGSLLIAACDVAPQTDADDKPEDPAGDPKTVDLENANLSFRMLASDGSDDGDFVFDVCLVGGPTQTVAIVEVIEEPRAILICHEATPSYRTSYEATRVKTLGVATGTPLSATAELVNLEGLDSWTVGGAKLKVGDHLLISSRPANQTWFVNQWIFVDLNASDVAAGDNFVTVDLPSNWNAFKTAAQEVAADFETNCPQRPPNYKTLSDTDYEAHQYTPPDDIERQCKITNEVDDAPPSGGETDE